MCTKNYRVSSYNDSSVGLLGFDVIILESSIVFILIVNSKQVC